MEEQVQKIQTFLLEGELLEAERELAKVKQWNKQLLIIRIMMFVFRKEVENGSAPTVFDYSLDLNVLVDHFVRLKIYIRRLEFELPLSLQMELYKYCKQTGVSDELLCHIVQVNMFYPEKVYKNLSAVFAEAEGADSFQASVYASLADQMRK